MPRDLRAYLWDMVEAGAKIERYIADKTLENYLEDDFLRSAVERQLTIVGEALVQTRQRMPDISQHLSFTREIAGFRNRMIHEYDNLDNTIVWGVVEKFLPQLTVQAKQLLESLEQE